MSDGTTGRTLTRKPATDWRRLHEMSDDDVLAAISDDPDINPLDEDCWKDARLVGKPTKGSIADARFARAVTRATIETCWLQRYETTIDRLQGVDAVGTDFFRVALNALLDARLVRLIRLLEKSDRTASFWYLHRTKPNIVDDTSKRLGIDLSKIEELSSKLRPIRDRAFIHIDKKAVFDPQQLYRDAGIQVSELKSVCVSLWEIMKEIYCLTFGKDFEYDEYDGSDIGRLAEFRDAAEAK